MSTIKQPFKYDFDRMEIGLLIFALNEHSKNRRKCAEFQPKSRNYLLGQALENDELVSILEDPESGSGLFKLPVIVRLLIALECVTNGLILVDPNLPEEKRQALKPAVRALRKRIAKPVMQHCYFKDLNEATKHIFISCSTKKEGTAYKDRNTVG